MELTDIFNKFSSLKIAVVGDVMLDAYLRGNVNRISPEAPVPIVAIEEKDERPGGAANVAVNLKELGAIPLLCSVIGNDGGGKQLIKVLRKNKIPVEGILFSDSRITTVKTRVLSRSHQMIRYDSEMTSDLDENDENNLIKKIKPLISKEKPDALIFEDYNKGILTPRLIRELTVFLPLKENPCDCRPQEEEFLFL